MYGRRRVGPIRKKLLADEINRTVGPFVEGLEIPPPITRYRNDWDTYYELLDESVRWYIDASDYLVRKNLDWDFMAVQLHIHDGINHVIAREIYISRPEGV
jgi:hypothetical protein